MGTYFHQVFVAFPRLNIVGERGAGKTKLLELVAALSFNGLHRVQPTSAVLYRLIEPLRPTFCLDEMEGLDGQEHKAINSILNAGYKRGASVDRTEGDGKNRHVVSYEVYAPAAFGSIAGVNGALGERCITIPMLRGQAAERINRSIDTGDPRFGMLRGWLYRLALLRISELRAAMADAFTVPDAVRARQRELFTPLLTIAALVGSDGVYLDVLRVAARAKEDRESLPEEGRALFLTLELQLARADSISFYPGDLVDMVSQELGMDTEHGRRIEPRKVGALLKRYGFRARGETNRGILYEITRADFIEKAQRNGYPFSGGFDETERTPPTGSGFQELANRDA